jgi:hypothetical protein
MFIAMSILQDCSFSTSLSFVRKLMFIVMPIVPVLFLLDKFVFR